MEKNTKFSLTVKKNVSHLPMPQISQGLHIEQLEDAHQSEHTTAVPIPTDLHLSLQ